VEQPAFKWAQDHIAPLAIVLAYVLDLDPLGHIEDREHIEEVDPVLRQIATPLGLVPFEQRLEWPLRHGRHLELGAGADAGGPA